MEGVVSNPLDERILPTGVTVVSYRMLQGVRTVANQAIGALATYDTIAQDTATSKVLRGELYALEGYAEIMLADLFCSGVPLSTLDFGKDFTYAPSSTTIAVYKDVLAKFTMALTLADTSTQVQNLTRVGRGRAFLDLGQYDSAAMAVAQVPDGFKYQLAVNWGGSSEVNLLNQTATVSDLEGGNGLPFRSSGDPRAAVNAVATVDENGLPLAVPLFFPQKYSSGLQGTGFAPFTVASSIEARLIQAEAALHAGDVTTWLTLLNQLRTGGSVTVPADTVADTLGVTDCGGTSDVCGSDPGGNDPAFGQPAGGFPVPAGYSFASADTVYPAPAGIQESCNANSWYNPCWAGDTMVVLIYVSSRPTHWHDSGHWRRRWPELSGRSGVGYGARIAAVPGAGLLAVSGRASAR